MDKARQLRDVWQAQVAKAGNTLNMDIVNGLNNMTLDVIGLAGALINCRVGVRDCAMLHIPTSGCTVLQRAAHTGQG